MANPANRTSEFREKILKEGFLRHKLTGALARWKLRYVVFKTVSSGRFQFFIYKEDSPSPSNEIKEIPIEEFGGIKSNLKLDNEKNVFAVISTNFTDCFSTETPEEMQEWVRLLQQYLGKELVLNITIPHKQNMLKSGKAQLRIRNTGFTITTCDNPPRCQGTWQIIHIRKFGGTDVFRFETGSKCPTGEFRYAITTDDNARVKALFNDLSQHKPIFTDDVVGRRMTLERRIRRDDRATSPVTRSGLNHTRGNRFSLQTREAPSHVYENRLRHINRDHFRYNSADLLMQPPSGRRHSANEDRICNPLTHPIAREFLRNGSSRSIEDLRDRDYQNVHRTSAHGRQSPLKRSHMSSVVSEDVPEGYYNVSPPRVVRYRNSSTSPPSASSPEEDSYLSANDSEPRREGRSGKTPPIEEEDERVNDEEYVHFTPVTMSLQGEHLVVQRGPSLNGHAGSAALRHGLPQLKMPTTQQQDGPEALYQNVEFMKGTGSNPASPLHGTSRESEKQRKVSTPSTNSTPTSERSSLSDVDWSPHNYTNVEFALESAQRRPVARAVSPRKTLSRHNESSLVHQVHTKKPSIPARRGYTERSRKISAPGMNPEPNSPHIRATLSPTRLTAIQSGLRNSHSNFELQSANAGESQPRESQPAALPEYYNLFYPDLPARSSRQSESIDSGVIIGTSSQPQSPSAESSKSGSDSDRMSVTSPTITSPPPVTTNGYAQFSRGIKSPVADSRLAGYLSLHGMQQMVMVPAEEQMDNPSRSGVAGREPLSNYDHLEIRSPYLSPEPPMETEDRASLPRPGSYDTLSLMAGEDRAASPRPGCYDTLAPAADENQPLQIIDFPTSASRVGVSSLEPALLPPAIIQKVVQYQRKKEVLGHGHNYEYVDMETTEQDESANCSDRTSQSLHQQSETPGKESRVTTSRSESPTGMEHPLEWLSPPYHTSNGGTGNAFNFEEEKVNRECTSPPSAIGHRFSRRTTNSGSRKKHLPLQDTPLEESDGKSNDSAEGTAIGVENPVDSKESPKIPPKKSKLRSGSKKEGSPSSDISESPEIPKNKSPKIPPKKFKRQSGSQRQGSPGRDITEAPEIPKKKLKQPGPIGTTSVDGIVERSTGDPLSPKKPALLPRMIRVDSQRSSDSSELQSSGEQDATEAAKRQSTVSNESASSLESDKKPLTLPSGRNLHSGSPLRRGTHEDVILKPPSGRIKSIKVETVQESNVAEDAIANPEPPPMPPKRTGSNFLNSSSEERLTSPIPGEDGVSVHSRPHSCSPSHVQCDQEGTPPRIPPYPKNFTVQLPRTNIEFDKPPVPPKPRLLSQASDPGDEDRPKYIYVDFGANSHLAQTRANQAQLKVKSQTLGSNRSERVDYLSIDFKMSAQLAILKEEREEERREFIAASKRN